MRSHLYRLRRSVSDPIFSFSFSFKVSPVFPVSPMSPMTLVFPVSPLPIAHPPDSEAWLVSGAFLESWMFRDSKNIRKWHSYFLFSWGNFCWTTPSNWKDTLVEELIVYFHFDPQNNITEHLSSRGPSHQLKRRSGSPSGSEIKEWKNSPCTWEKNPHVLGKRGKYFDALSSGCAGSKADTTFILSNVFDNFAFF